MFNCVQMPKDNAKKVGINLLLKLHLFIYDKVVIQDQRKFIILDKFATKSVLYLSTPKNVD